jgi:hypothetical protein
VKFDGGLNSARCYCVERQLTFVYVFDFLTNRRVLFSRIIAKIWGSEFLAQHHELSGLFSGLYRDRESKRVFVAFCNVKSVIYLLESNANNFFPLLKELISDKK